MAPAQLQGIALIVQTLSVLVGIGASVVALVIASRNRRANLHQAHLMFELDAAVRLMENLWRGGTSDQDTPPKLERSRMGAEAMALIGALGPERVPTNWERRQGADDQIRALIGDADYPEFRRLALEAQLAVNAIAREIAKEEGRPRKGGRPRPSAAPAEAAEETAAPQG